MQPWIKKEAVHLFFKVVCYLIVNIYFTILHKIPF